MLVGSAKLVSGCRRDSGAVVRVKCPRVGMAYLDHRLAGILELGVVVRAKAMAESVRRPVDDSLFGFLGLDWDFCCRLSGALEEIVVSIITGRDWAGGLPETD